MGKVLPFRPRDTAASWSSSRTFVPLDQGVNDVDRATLVERIDAARAVISTPAYCREPECSVVVSTEHPLPADFPASVACGLHVNSGPGRYAHLDELRAAFAAALENQP